MPAAQTNVAIIHRHIYINSRMYIQMYVYLYRYIHTYIERWTDRQIGRWTSASKRRTWRFRPGGTPGPCWALHSLASGCRGAWGNVNKNIHEPLDTHICTCSYRFTYLSICLSICRSIYLSICLSAYLSISLYLYTSDMYWFV